MRCSDAAPERERMDAERWDSSNPEESNLAGKRTEMAFLPYLSDDVHNNPSTENALYFLVHVINMSRTGEKVLLVISTINV